MPEHPRFLGSQDYEAKSTSIHIVLTTLQYDSNESHCTTNSLRRTNHAYSIVEAVLQHLPYRIEEAVKGNIMVSKVVLVGPTLAMILSPLRIHMR